MNSLAELFAMDPLELTKSPEDLDRLIAELRTQRAQFMLGGSKATKAVKQETVDIDLDSL